MLERSMMSTGEDFPKSEGWAMREPVTTTSPNSSSCSCANAGNDRSVAAAHVKTLAHALAFIRIPPEESAVVGCLMYPRNRSGQSQNRRTGSYVGRIFVLASRSVKAMEIQGVFSRAACATRLTCAG